MHYDTVLYDKIRYNHMISHNTLGDAMTQYETILYDTLQYNSLNQGILCHFLNGKNKC